MVSAYQMILNGNSLQMAQQTLCILNVYYQDCHESCFPGAICAVTRERIDGFPGV
jgi:hypothetical protein